jgi:Leucine-rich repeat (LRR) protein
MNKGAISVLLGVAALGALSSKFKGSKSSQYFRPNNPKYIEVSFDVGFWAIETNNNNINPEDVEYISVSFDLLPNYTGGYVKGMQEISEKFPNIKGLEILQDVPNYIKFIPLFPNLEEISLSSSEFFDNFQRTGFHNIPDEIIQNERITRLSLTGCEFTEFPKELSKMTHLKYLNLSNNQFMFDPNISGSVNKSFRRISKLTNLEFLNLVRTGLHIIPEEITSLSKLNRLIINYNLIEYIPRSIVKLDNLIDLRFSNNPISSFPDYLCELTNLRRLEIKGTKIKEIPNHFGNLKKLVYFNQNRLLECPSPMQVAIWISQGMSQSIISDIIRYCKKPSKRSSELRRF